MRPGPRRRAPAQGFTLTGGTRTEHADVGGGRGRQGSQQPPWREVKNEVSGTFFSRVDGICAKRT